MFKLTKLERGQSFMEAALGFVFFLLFLSGLFDLGRAYFIFVALEDAAGEAALFTAMNKECINAGDSGCPSGFSLQERAQNASFVDLDAANISHEFFEDPDVGPMVKVMIKYDFSLMTPIISQIVGGGELTLTAEASQAIIN